MSEWWPRMTLRSVMRFREYSIRSNKEEYRDGNLLKLVMRKPFRGEVLLRERGSDTLTFTEVIQQEVYKEVVTAVRDCHTVIDLGANIGLASRYFADHFPNCKILAVEPNPSTYEILLLNVDRLVANGRCRTLRAAVWGSEKTLTGEAVDDPDHFSAFAVHETVAASGEESIAGWPMSKLIADSGFERVDLLKVDIEGAEVELFKGNVDWLQQVRTIAIEFHDNSREECGFDDLMKEYGFRVVDSGSHTVLALKDNSQIAN
ncbi:MAG TPA: FkbM family methyltransferase [Pyrinomonadaceae bacterium]|nr:FkbM family methyltransferase [Pyrinomonadaceae bacterium]